MYIQICPFLFQISISKHSCLIPVGHKKKKKKHMKKKQNIIFRCTTLEKSIIEKKASHSGASVSAYCRATSLGQRINFKLTEEELGVYEMLTRYHNNFVSISNLLKKKDSTFAKEVSSTALEIKRHLKKLQ